MKIPIQLENTSIHRLLLNQWFLNAQSKNSNVVWYKEELDKKSMFDVIHAKCRKQINDQLREVAELCLLKWTKLYDQNTYVKTDK